MRNEKANMIIKYINQLYCEIDEYKNDFFSLKSYDDLYDIIREICQLFIEEMPSLSEKLLWKKGCGYNDARLTIAFLKKYLIDNNMVELIDNEIEKFWNRYKAWYDSEVYSCNYLKSEYLEEDKNSFEQIPSINYENEYMKYYGRSYPLSLKYEIYDFQDIVSFIEIVFNNWILKNKRYEYTIYVNRLFSESNLPYHLKSGKVQYKGYRSSDDNTIINQKMFEDKLEQSRKLILSNDIQNKKLSLKLIVDCLEYLESTQQGNTKKREQLANSVSINPDSKLIIILKKELNSINIMVNNYFDIRHNKLNNDQGDIREVLDKVEDIEYVYNRIHATVQLLSTKSKEKK